LVEDARRLVDASEPAAEPVQLLSGGARNGEWGVAVSRLRRHNGGSGLVRGLSMRAFLLMAAVAGALIAAPVHAKNDELARAITEYETLARKADPVAAGRDGDAAALRLWPDVSPMILAARAKAYEALRQQVLQISSDRLSASERIDHALLSNRLAMLVEAAPFGEERVPFISGDGFYTVADYAAFATTISDEAQAEAWVARLSALPTYLAANVANMRRGLAAGFTQPRLTTANAVKSVRAQLEQPTERSSLLLPLAKLPPSISEQRQRELRAQAATIVEREIKPAQRAVLQFLETEYLPRTRSNVGIGAVPGGAEYYAHLIRRNTTTTLTADGIHQLGLQELARIRGEMAGVMQEVGFKGSLPEFLAELRSDPRFYATSVDAYIDRAAEIAKRIDAEVPRVIGKLPRLTFGLKRVPPEVANTSSGYWQGDPKAGLPGSVMIHNERVLKFPLFQLPAWVLHEGVPGHHTQIALAQELDGVSAFRRNEDITAFTEGWALYAERLGVEMGIYLTPYERFGRLSYEAWRASRLVIDTGLHSQGWSRQRAVDYLKSNTALSQLEVDNEIDRYIGWPGQALAYKIGELRIRAARAKAEAALGPKFDVRAFHDAVLANGPVTLLVLESRLAEWTREQQ
jgi:uncharacterized protein (DUF885 family)